MGVIKSGRYHSLMIGFIGIFAFLSSCKDKDYPQATPDTNTNLNVINATADTLNYYINGMRQNNASSLYPGGSTYYLNPITGAQNYSFKKNGSAVVLFNTTYTLDTGKNVNYSIFIGGESNAKTFLTVDNLNQANQVVAADASNTTGALRFVHAAPGMGALNVVVNKGDTINLTNCSFKYVSPFMLVKDTVNEVKVYQTGSSTPIVDTTFTFQSDVIYTLFAKGMVNGSGNSAFSVVLLTTGP